MCNMNVHKSDEEIDTPRCNNWELIEGEAKGMTSLEDKSIHYLLWSIHADNSWMHDNHRSHSFHLGPPPSHNPYPYIREKLCVLIQNAIRE